MKVAIVEKNKSSIDWKKYFPDFEFDLYALSAVKAKKLKVGDISIEIDEDKYDFIIPVGAEPTKFFDKKASVLSHQGYLTKGKYIPLVNPAMVRMKPEGKPAFDEALKNIINYITGETKPASDLNVVLVRTGEHAESILQVALDFPAKEIAIDTEATGFYCRKAYIIGVSIAYKEDECFYIDHLALTEECEDLLRQIANTKKCIFHNSKFDMHLIKHDFSIEFVDIEDTLILHYILDENSPHGLKDLSIKYTDLGDYDRELDLFKRQYCKNHKIRLKDFTYDLIPFDILGNYAAIDAVATLRLYNKFKPIVNKSGNLSSLYKETMIPATRALQIIEDNGVPFNRELLESTKLEIARELVELEEQIYHFDVVSAFEQERGKQFNVNSPNHVRTVLFDMLNLTPSKKTDTGAWSTDSEVLEELESCHALPALILKIKKHKKIKATYIDKVLAHLDSDDRLRTGFNLCTTTSGRLSSSGTLNVQQIPRDDKRVKHCIQAKEGNVIVSQDLKTAEVFVVGCLARDFNLLDTFKRGEDFHGFIAKLENNLTCTVNEVKTLYPDLRQDAKAFSFRVLYQLDLRHPVLKRFPALRKFLEDKVQEILEYGYVYTASKRKRRLPNVFSDNREISQHYVRSGINALVQSVSSDINMRATIEIVNWIKANNYDIKVFMMVHDSIVAEVPIELVDQYNAKLLEVTQRDYFDFIPAGFKIGVDVEIGESYAFK